MCLLMHVGNSAFLSLYIHAKAADKFPDMAEKDIKEGSSVGTELILMVFFLMLFFHFHALFFKSGLNDLDMPYISSQVYYLKQLRAARRYLLMGGTLDGTLGLLFTAKFTHKLICLHCRFILL